MILTIDPNFLGGLKKITTIPGLHCDDEESGLQKRVGDGGFVRLVMGDQSSVHRGDLVGNLKNQPGNQDLQNEYHLRVVTKNLDIFCRGWSSLPSYVGIMMDNVNEAYKDPYSTTSRMER